MQRSIALLSVAVLLTACGGSDFSTNAASGGTTGAAASGGRMGRGGSGATTTPTTTPAVDCSALWQSYMTALEAARVCDASLGDNACNASWVLTGLCGCNVFVNGESTAYADAQAAYEKFKGSDCDTAACEQICPPHNASMAAPACRSAGDGVNVCQW